MIYVCRSLEYLDCVHGLQVCICELYSSGPGAFDRIDLNIMCCKRKRSWPSAGVGPKTPMETKSRFKGTVGRDPGLPLFNSFYVCQKKKVWNFCVKRASPPF